VARAIEDVYAPNLEPHFEALGTHYREGEVWKKAAHYLQQAGLKAAARSALEDARAWFEQALRALAVLPESQSTLEQAFEIHLELRPVLGQLGDFRQMRESLLGAEVLAEKLNDDRQRGRFYALMMATNTLVGKLDEVLVAGHRALEIAERVADLRLRVFATSYLANTHYVRGDYERVVELTTDNLAALPGDWVYEYFGRTAPPSVYDRCFLVRSSPSSADSPRRRCTRPMRSDSPSRRIMRTQSLWLTSLPAYSTSSGAIGRKRAH
jgi:tetratricopeptide (TPR) repeat protein